MLLTPATLWGELIMKITLDLSKLVEEGKLSPAEAERLKALAKHETGSLGINILIGFGVVSVASGVGALVPTAITALVIGGALFATGLALILRRAEAWDLLAQICLVIGALTLAGAVLYLDDGSLRAAIAVTLGLAVSAVIARSSLLAALAVMSLAGCFGASTGYMHAMYSLSIQEPAVTIVVFSALALSTYLISKRVKADYERIALIAARTSVFMVNFGFWIGSLWGDRLRLLRSMGPGDSTPAAATKLSVVIPPYVFSIGWALALIAVGVWGARENRRWVVNIAAVFGAIHFYTQWFEKLGANAFTVLIGGLIMLAIAITLWKFNRRATKA
jgi:iron complex transport system permease protein